MRVVTTIQSEGNDPVEMVWCKDGDVADVLLSVAQILRHNRDEDDAPWAARHLDIRIEL